MYEGQILFVKDGSFEGSLSAQWLCDWPAGALADSGYFVDVITLFDAVDPGRWHKRLIERADIIIFERHVDDAWMPFLEWCLKHKRLFLTMDDAYWCAPTTTRTAAFWSEKRLSRMEEVASQAEGVIVPSKRLAAHFANGIYHPNRPNFKDGCWSVSLLPFGSDGVVIWGGTEGHIDGMREHPCLEAISQLDIQFAAVCGSSSLSSAIEDSVPSAMIFPSMFPYYEWLKVVSGATVAICPIGSEYDEHRSWIKALEAIAVGVPWIASDVGVYDGVEGGLLVENTTEGWYAGLRLLLENHEYRQGLVEEGIRWAWRQGLHDHVDELEVIFHA